MGHPNGQPDLKLSASERNKYPIPGTGTEAANCSRFSAAAGSIPDTAAAAAAAAAVVVIGGGAVMTAAVDEATEDVTEVTGAALCPTVVTATDSGWVAAFTAAATAAALFRSGGLSI